MEGSGQPELTPEQRHELYLEAHYSGIAASLTSGNMSVPEFIKTLKEERQGMEKYIEKDAMTGAFSRIHMEDAIDKEAAQARRSNSTLGLVFLDLDHFKQVNDTYGHQAGDTILKGFVKIVQGKLDELGGSVGRWGGEEFVILFPNTGEEEMLKIMTDVGRAVCLGTGFEGNIPQLQTVSCGAGILKEGESVADWINRVDKLNYEAKGDRKDAMGVVHSDPEGRNRMVMERADGSRAIVKFNQV